MICYRLPLLHDTIFNEQLTLKQSIMKRIANKLNLLLAICLLTGFAAMAQNAGTTSSSNKNKTEMKTFVIEREIPNAGQLTPAQLKAISQTSCGVLKEMGPDIEWDHSYVTGNKIYCVYRAKNEALIREHAKRGGFPANAVNEVATIISPATAE
jgi:hypothetical protein